MEELTKNTLIFKIFLSKHPTKLQKEAFYIMIIPKILLNTSTVKDIVQLCQHQKINLPQGDIIVVRKTLTTKNHIPRLCWAILKNVIRRKFLEI